jgi:formylglycine-generating enzyme required for sulfatase activity
MDEQGTSQSLGRTVISHYETGEAIGHGAMGTVHRATDLRDGRPVAIKLIHPHVAQDPLFSRAFEREAHLASLFRSPYTVRMLDYGRDQGTYFLAMEFVDGPSLQQLLNEGPLDVERALGIARDVALALQEAESLGVVHRDIKPANVMIDRSGPAKLADFGVATNAFAASLTATADVAGSPAYTAPEASLGRADHRSDIYSLGATLYHMLAARPPFDGTPIEVLRKHSESPPPLEPLASIAAPVREIVLASLRKDPAARQQRAASLVADIEHAARAIGVSLRGAPLAFAASRDALATSALPPQANVRDRGPWLKGRGRLLAIDLALMGALACALAFSVCSLRDDPESRASVPPVALGDSACDQAKDQIEAQLPDMVCVPGATFIMGDDRVHSGDVPYWPAHERSVSAFLIDVTEVTNAAYKRWLDAGTAGHVPYPSSQDPAAAAYSWVNGTFPEGTATHPVVLVSWFEASAYCAAAGKRLPTEAEWEFAARGADGRDWPWGEVGDGTRLNFTETEHQAVATYPVGSFPTGASLLGIMDMAGNVWEWVSDDFAFYDEAAGPPPEGAKVSRGGGFSSPLEGTRAFVRNWDGPDFRNQHLGFRCAADLPAG